MRTKDKESRVIPFYFKVHPKNNAYVIQFFL
jgi:hypothetical protein